MILSAVASGVSFSFRESRTNISYVASWTLIVFIVDELVVFLDFQFQQFSSVIVNFIH